MLSKYILFMILSPINEGFEVKYSESFNTQTDCVITQQELTEEHQDFYNIEGYCMNEMEFKLKGYENETI